jgi:P-type Ca2+ transporter type 2C
VENFFDSSKRRQVIPEAFHNLIEYGILASKKDPFDPMEKALTVLETKIDKEHLHNFPLVQEYPINRDIIALSHVRDDPKSDYHIVASK